MHRRAARCLLNPDHKVKMHGAACHKAQPLVHTYGPLIIGPYMQKRVLALLQNEVQLVQQQQRSIAFSPIIGMGAHGTYLGIVAYVQALAGHGSQPAIFKNAVVSAKLDGAAAKGPGPGEAGKRYHLFDVRLAQGL